MIGLATSCLPLNASLRIQNLQFASAPWSHTRRKQLNNFKDVILGSMPNMPFYEGRQTRHFFEARQASHFMKHAKSVSTANS